MTKANKFQGLASLGTGPLRQACTQFVGLLYGKSNCSSLNHLRVELAAKQGKTRVPRIKLPPTEDSFVLHLLRCVYKLAIWLQAMVAVQEL